MASLPRQRRAWAQELRRVAHLNGIDRVSDNAGRDEVKGMADAILACAPPARLTLHEWNKKQKDDGTINKAWLEVATAE